MAHLCLDVWSTETARCFNGRQSSVWQQRKHTLSNCFISLRLVQSFIFLCVKSKICHSLTGTIKSNYVPLFNLKPPFASQRAAGPYGVMDGSGWYKAKSSWLSAHWTWNCKMLSERPARNPHLVWWKMAVIVQAWAKALPLNLASLSLAPPGTETLAYFSQRCFSMLAGELYLAPYYIINVTHWMVIGFWLMSVCPLSRDHRCLKT